MTSVNQDPVSEEDGTAGPTAKRMRHQVCYTVSYLSVGATHALTPTAQVQPCESLPLIPDMSHSVCKLSKPGIAATCCC